MGHHVEQAGDAAARGHAEQSSAKADGGGLGQDERGHVGPGGAHRAEHADLPGALAHAGKERVGDVGGRQRGDQRREQAEHGGDQLHGGADLQRAAALGVVHLQAHGLHGGHHGGHGRRVSRAQEHAGERVGVALELAVDAAHAGQGHGDAGQHRAVGES